MFQALLTGARQSIVKLWYIAWQLLVEGRFFSAHFFSGGLQLFTVYVALFPLIILCDDTAVIEYVNNAFFFSARWVKLNLFAIRVYPFRNTYFALIFSFTK